VRTVTRISAEERTLTPNDEKQVGERRLTRRRAGPNRCASSLDDYLSKRCQENEVLTGLEKKDGSADP